MNKREMQKHKENNNNTITPIFFMWKPIKGENHGGDSHNRYTM
jgi:hypothetical protein